MASDQFDANPTPSSEPTSKSEGLSLSQARFGKSPPTPFEISTDLSQPAEPNQPGAGESLSFQTEPPWLIGLKAAGVFVLTFLIIYGLIQSPALWSRLSYALNNLGRNTTSAAPLMFLPKLKDRSVTLTEIKAQPEEYFQPELQLSGYRLTDLGDNQLLIPKIQIKAPIIWDSPLDEASILKNLEGGVVRYNFTALPSDGRGNIFIFGHSSGAIWSPGSYKTVFANLDRLSAGDQLALTYQGIVYIYEVVESVVVKPDDLTVLDQTDQPILSLMTCVPVGTDRNRLVVRSKLISASSTQPIPLPPENLRIPPAIFSYLPF